MSILEVGIRIIFAIVASGLIGYERELRNRPAGFRTHVLVCVGATIVALVQMQMVYRTVEMINQNPVLANSLKADIGRVVAQVVTGVGFLGGGTIITHKGSVKGLTTATTLWIVACLGIAIGLGYYIISAVATISILFVIITLKRIEDFARARKDQLILDIKYQSENDNFIMTLVDKINKNGGNVKNIRLYKDDKKTLACKVEIHLSRFVKVETLMSKLSGNTDIISIEKVDKLG